MVGKSRLKERLRAGELIVSTALRFPDPAALEVIALSGVDMITIDYEHYPFNEETLIHLARAADARGAALIVRVPNAEPERISRIMDCGVEGIHLPGVETYDEAMALVKAVKYAPVGTRGFCPITRAADYGMSGMSWEEFAAHSNRHSMLIVQIETVAGLANLDKILTIPEIDMVVPGPSDMAASMGIPGQNSDPRVKAATQEIKEKAIKAGKFFSCKADTPEEMRRLRENGANMVGISSEQQVLMAGYREMVKAAGK